MAFPCHGMPILDLGAMALRPSSQPAPEEPAYLSRQVKAAERFYLGAPSSASDGLCVTCGGWERVTPDYRIRRETFPWLAVEFVVGGCGELAIGAQRHELHRGCCFTYGPGVAHSIRTHPAKLLSKYFVDFTGREASNLLSAVRLAPGGFRVVENAAELETILRLLVADGRQHRPNTPAIVALQLRLLLLKLGAGPGTAVDDDRRAQQALQRCLDHIDQHYVSLATAEEVADACHVSPSYLSRLFRRFGHGSPYEHLTRKRMVHAAELLDSGHLLVREVAERLGMDPFHFSRVFKRIHGLSPAQFIRRHGLEAARE